MAIEETTNKDGEMPDLSVIIPVFNGEEYLEPMVQALVVRENMSFEVIIVDDCSTDRTPEIIGRLAQNDKVSIHTLPEHSGQSAARNQGLSMARGKYVVFLDADDVLLATLDIAVQVAKELEMDILCPAAHLITAAEKYVRIDDTISATPVLEFNLKNNQTATLEDTPAEITKFLLNSNIYWSACGKIYRREFLLEHNIRFLEDMHLVEGMFFLLSCALHAQKVVFFPVSLYFCREMPTALLQRKRSVEDIKELLELEMLGLKRLEDLFRDFPDQGSLPLAKARFCAQMDKAIEPIALESPDVWKKMKQEWVPLSQDSWWIERHVAGWYQNSVRIRQLLNERQEQQAIIAASDQVLDDVLKVPRIIVLSSLYSMLLCLLYFRDWEKSIFVCGGGIPSNMVQNLKKQKVLCYGSGDGRFIVDANILQCLARYAQRNNIPVYGNDDPPEAGQLIQQNFTVVEDGTSNYLPENVSNKEHVIRIAANGEPYLPFGFNRFTKHILLTGKLPVPDAIKKKAKIINIQKLWDQKTEKEQDKILDLYAFPRKDLERQLRKGRDCLFLGVPHSTLGLCSEEQEVALYREMMEPYGQKRLIVKPHPQSKMNFKKYFPDCFVMPKDFPVDLIKLLGIKFHRVIGAHSSSLAKVFPSKIVEDRVDIMIKMGIPLDNADPALKKRSAAPSATEGVAAGTAS